MAQKLTKEQALIVTGFTGVLCCSFSDFHKDVTERLGQAVWTHQFAAEAFREELKEVYREDFMNLVL